MEILNVIGAWLSETYEVILLGVASVSAVLGTAWGTISTVGKKLIPIQSKVDNSITQEQYNTLNEKLDFVMEMEKDNTQAILETNTYLSDETRVKLMANVDKSSDYLPKGLVDTVKEVVSKY